MKDDKKIWKKQESLICMKKIKRNGRLKKFKLQKSLKKQQRI